MCNTMVTITDSGLRSTVFETIYDIINTDKSLYASALTPSWNPTLYGGLPDLDTISFPSIIIMPITVNETEFTIDTSRQSTTKDITVNILLFAKKNKDLDYLSDGITNSLKLVTQGIVLNQITESFNAIYPNDQKIKSKTLNFSFSRR